MIRKFGLLLLALMLGGAAGARADDAPKPEPYFDPAKIDSRTLLPTPPANDSQDTQRELEYMFQLQSTRTPEQVARIQAEAPYSLSAFGDVAGPVLDGIGAGTLPATTSLLQRVRATAKPVAQTAAEAWNRQPPFAINSRIFPAVEKPKGGSYPSPDSTRATIDALVLAELVPSQKEAILARGREIGDDRVIAGVQFPSDVKAGRILGQEVFRQMMQDPAFQADLAAARQEVRKVGTGN